MKNFSLPVATLPTRATSRIPLILLLIGVCFFSACSKPAQPEYLRTENVKVVKANLKEVVVSADMVFHNPNSMGLTVAGMDIKLHANEIEARHLVQELEQKVEADSEFTLPVLMNFPAGKIFQKENLGDILSGVLDALSGKEVELQYLGSVKVKIGGIPISIPVSHKEKKKIMQNKGRNS